VKFDISVFLKNLLKEFKFPENLTRKKGTVREDPSTLLIIPY
jgi:hypothetical protein